MYIETVPNRDSRPAILLRVSQREGKRVHKRTLANLSDWPSDRIEAFRRLLRGEKLVPASERLTIEQSKPHGHVQAILLAMRKLGLDTVIAAKRCRERDLVIAMIAERLIHPCSKLASTRHWHDTTLAEELVVGDADVDELYDALDWLLARQARIERKLAARYLKDGDRVQYDVSSSYYEGHTCPLAQFGHNRDGKKGLPIIVYGLMTDRVGRPVAVEVYAGNVADPTTLADQVGKLRGRFDLSRVVLVGDRGMLTQARLEELKKHPGLGWISALRSGSIRTLVAEGSVQASLFDERNLAEIVSPEFPGERLIACFNPLLAEQRRRKREELLAATEKELARVAAAVARRTRKPLSKDQIGVKVGRVSNRFKVAKHFTWTIEDGVLKWERREDSIRQERETDGIYVVRTSEPAKDQSSEDTVRAYKSLAHVERAFRCLKGSDLRIRPIHHRTENHVRAHVFLCMLAYHVEWHLRQAWAALLFHDEELAESRDRRDPVAPAKPSPSVQRKKFERTTTDGLEVQSWDTLLAHLATLARHTCRLHSPDDLRTGPTFNQVTESTPLQKRAFELLELYPV
ncbi:MAG: IS1634 family transposase [Planctomycetes bacterium]|nr:IS1634 family transposase [Planctomycetota bacterium]